MAENNVAPYRLIVIGGSAGSLDVILKLIASLPYKLNASIVVVVHRKNDADSIFANLLSARTNITVKEVEDKELLLPGTIYIAPPNYHLLLEDKHTFALDSSEKVQYSRPSIDVTFASAAQVYGAAMIGILLSGANSDGAAGLKAVKQNGGFTIVQDPATAEVAYMPQQAINAMQPDAVLNAEKINQLLNSFFSGNKKIG